MKKFLRSKAPLRVSFAGGGTDIEAVYKEIGGAVLVATINKYSYVSLSQRDDRQIVIRSLDLNMQVSYSLATGPVYDGALDLVKACVETLGVESGLDICIQTEAPPGSGLGSSSSMISAVLAGLNALRSRHLDLYELAEQAYDVERIKMKISGGRQDQYACVFGGFNFVEFASSGVEVTPLRLRDDILNDLECHCMLCFTGGTRLSSRLIDKQVDAFRHAKGASREGTQALRDMAYQAKNLLLRGKIVEFGRLLHDAGEAKKKMNPETTTPEIDRMYEAAREEGAYGGKILGAGGGGFLLLFVPSDCKVQVRARLEKMGGVFTNFSFYPAGVQTWASSCP